jgi:MFS family permease
LKTNVRLPAIMRHRDFNLYWAGVIFSQIGTRGTIAAQLFHVFLLTGSTVQVGFVGLSQAIALLVLSPLGGAYADRLDRRRLLQASQLVAMIVSLIIAVLTISGDVQPWHIYLSVVLQTAAATFDQPARQALIPAMVPRDELVHAFALINPSREVAILVGPALAGVLISVWGPEAMYLVDAGTYAGLVVVLALLHIPRLKPARRAASLWTSIAEGVSFVRGRPIIWQLMSLDLSATLFAAYRVLLPAIAVDILDVGPTGYGLLSAAPSAGALIGAALVFKLTPVVRSGHLVLSSTVAFGLCAIAFAQAPILWIALLAAVGLGVFDALATTVRHAAVQLETPDEIRGRVSAIYQMASRGGPALGDLNIGWIAGSLGPQSALTLGGLVPVVYASMVAASRGRVSKYQVPAHEGATADEPERKLPT